MATLGMLVILPPVTFLLFLFMGYLLYKLGDAMAPPLTAKGAKLKTYACGESRRFPGRMMQPSFHLFHMAFLFTIVHVSILMLATFPLGVAEGSLMSAKGFALSYLVAMVLSVIALLAR